MAGTDFYYVDNHEQRFQLGHMCGYLDNIIACLKHAPDSIKNLDEIHTQTLGEALFDPGNFPKVPEELTLDTIRRVLGMLKEPENEVLSYWENRSAYRKLNYKTLETSIDIESPIPEINKSLRAEWKSEDPAGEEFPTLKDYRRAQASGNGVVIVDFRNKTLTYMSTYFTINKKDLPKSWKLIRA